jgi:hypothetical protein
MNLGNRGLECLEGGIQRSGLYIDLCQGPKP